VLGDNCFCETPPLTVTDQVMFHFLFPVPRPPRMLWGFIFACGHAYSLYHYLREHYDYALDDDDREVYEQLFEEFGFTKYQFMQIMAQSQVREVKAGQVSFCAPLPCFITRHPPRR
jgi:hypothetical protein